MSQIKELRQSVPGLTQLELSKLACVTRHSILRLEQLCYPTPLPEVVATLSEITNISEALINAAYAQDVQDNRRLSGVTYFANHYHLISIAEQHNQPDSISHNFKNWREYIMLEAGEPISAIHFCQLTSIHPATLSRYEAFKTGFPGAVGVALKGLLIPFSLIDYFASTPSYNIRNSDD